MTKIKMMAVEMNGRTWFRDIEAPSIGDDAGDHAYGEEDQDSHGRG